MESPSRVISSRAPVPLVEAAELIAERRGVTMAELLREGLRSRVREELGLDTEECHRERVPA